MEKLNVEKLVKERIKENEKLFTGEELIFLNNHVNIIKKVYLMGVIDGGITNKSGQKSGQEENLNHTFLERQAL